MGLVLRCLEQWLRPLVSKRPVVEIDAWLTYFVCNFEILKEEGQIYFGLNIFYVNGSTFDFEGKMGVSL